MIVNCQSSISRMHCCRKECLDEFGSWGSRTIGWSRWIALLILRCSSAGCSLNNDFIQDVCMIITHIQFPMYRLVISQFRFQHSTSVGVFHSDSTNKGRIPHWRTVRDRACHSASFTYMSYCVMIRIHVINWSQSSEFVKLWNQQKNPRFSAVRFLMG